MASRLLLQLASRIAAARDPVEAACLRAQRGIYLARQGNQAEAQAIVDAIRAEFGARPSAEATAWISLVEALLHFYSQPGPKALDRLRRAHALSRAMNHPVLVPLCAAWLAHIEFNANRMEPMLQYAVEALRLAQPSTTTPRWRGSAGCWPTPSISPAADRQALVCGGPPACVGRGRRRDDQRDVAQRGGVSRE